MTMKKYLACSEIRLSISEISEIPEIRPIDPIFVEPDNLAHPLQLAEKILKLINSYVENQVQEHKAILKQLKEASQPTLKETSIATIEKFQNFYSRPVALTLPCRRFPFSLSISPYQLALIASVLTSASTMISYHYVQYSQEMNKEKISLDKVLVEYINSKSLIHSDLLVTRSEFEKQFDEGFDPANFRKDFFKKAFYSSENSIGGAYTINAGCAILPMLSAVISYLNFSTSVNLNFRDFRRIVVIPGSLIHSSLFVMMSVLAPESFLNTMTYPNLSHRFDQVIQRLDKISHRISLPTYSKDLSIETCCRLYSMMTLGITFSALFLIINQIGILDKLKLLINTLSPTTPPQESILTKLNTEEARIKTDINHLLTPRLEDIEQQNLTDENKEKLNQLIKKLTIDTLIEMLNRTINLPLGTSDFSQRSPAATLEQKLHVLFRKITDEQIQEGDSPESIERKFNNIKSLLEDRILLMEIPLFPVLHLEPEMVSGIREMPAIHPSETRIPRDPSFQEIQADRDRLNSLIKQLLKGETGYINNRSATSLVVHPERRSYPIQFSKELFPAFLFLNMIQKVIEEIEALPTSTFNLQDLSRPPAIEPDDNINTVAQGIL